MKAVPTTPRSDQLNPLLPTGRRGIGRGLAFGVLTMLMVAVVGCSQADAELPTPTPFPSYELTDEQLKQVPFGPGDLPPGTPPLRIAALSGLISNHDLAENTFALADTAESWNETGRITGHLVELETFDPEPLFVQSGVDRYVDSAAARRGFSIVARDIWETEGQLKEGLTFEQVRERRIPDLGDEALLQRSTIDFGRTAAIESIGFRRGNLVAFVQVVAFEGADATIDIEALARLLDERITAVVDGSATWGAEAIPVDDASDQSPAARIRLPDLDDASAPGIGSATADALDPSEEPQFSTELATWAHSFCSAAQSTFVDWVDSTEEFARRIESLPPVEAYRDAIDDYLVAVWQAGQDFEAHTSALALPDGADALGIVDLHQAIREYAAWDTELYNSLMPRVHAANTTGELAGLMVEFSVTVAEDPTLLLIQEAYDEVHLSVTAALREAGPCGQFENGGFTGAQVA